MFTQVSYSFQFVNSTSAYVNCGKLLIGRVPNADTDLAADNIYFAHEDKHNWSKHLAKLNYLWRRLW